MLKNILAVVGLYFVAKKGYEHYQEYSELKREKEKREQGGQSNCQS
ncbi:hypothetical protein [Geopseudomonas guangdongensis]|uniref:Uncharacterized protein n=1 Tax=Geopseudomonas guangdongensis TaxID=1245526 RepID=A0A1H2ECK3_9GAMM|nr:hypothetical protein [Pseudomonas guangdongensis]SDT92753.1 hypothetical protein SAMN05216580_0493 [Pseudomonas guangdongensis]